MDVSESSIILRASAPSDSCDGPPLREPCRTALLREAPRIDKNRLTYRTT